MGKERTVTTERPVSGRGEGKRLETAQTTGTRWFPAIKMKRSRTRTISSQSHLTPIYYFAAVFKVHCDDHFYLVASKVGRWSSQRAAIKRCNCVVAEGFQLGSALIQSPLATLPKPGIVKFSYFLSRPILFILPWSNFMLCSGRRHQYNVFFFIWKCRAALVMSLLWPCFWKKPPFSVYK